jgi:catechol 2,3-dioxygenase-like lactoylglutathione lyase family enzyme
MIAKRLAHINIGADDLQASEKFYCDVLGMEKTFEFIKEGKPYGFYVNAGNDTYIEVFINEVAVNRERPLLRHICLEVEDIDKAIEEVRGNGWKIGDKKLGCDNSWQAWMKDPSGVDIEVMQYTPESSQFTGAPCNVNW